MPAVIFWLRGAPEECWFPDPAGALGEPNGLLRLGLRIARNLAISELRRMRVRGVATHQVDERLDVERTTAAWLALISAAVWMLHPFLVSTTLYAVQRMAQLAMMFSLGGLITYLYGRSLLATNKTPAYLYGCSVFAGQFCKKLSFVSVKGRRNR